MKITDIFGHMIPITQFNKGKASQLFSRVQTGEPLIVLKNNSPVAIIISPEEYAEVEQYRHLKKLEKDYD